MALLTSLGTCTFSSPSRLSFSPIQSQSQSLNATSSGFPPLRSSRLSVSISAPSTPLPVCCGRGDKKTRKGKRFKHSYGNARPRNKTKGRGPAPAPTPPNPYKKKYEEEFDRSELEKMEPMEPIPNFD